MAFEITSINGVTKRIIDSNTNEYIFPSAIIHTDTSNPDTAQQTYKFVGANSPQSQPIKFAQITDKLGASTVVEYIEIIANRGFFVNPIAPNGPEISLFNELEVAERYPIIEQKSTYPVSNLRDNIISNGSATMQNDTGEYKISTTASGVDSLEVKTFEISRDISHTDSNTGIGVRFPLPPTGNIFAEWGLFDGVNGLLFGYDATGLYIRLVREGIDAFKTYSNDWTNEDGYIQSIDLTKGIVFNIDFAHYGYGSMVFSVYTETPQLKYKKYVVHRAEFNGGVNLVNPNLPIYSKLDNAGTATAFDMYLGGRQFSVIGAYAPTYRINGDMGTFSGVGTTPTLIASFRRKASYNMINARLSEISISPNDTAYYYIVQGNTLTGAGWVNLGNQQANETALEKDLTASDTIDGILIDFGFAVGANRNTEVTREGVDLPLSNQQAFSLYLASQSGTISGTWSLKFLEEW